MSIVRLIFKEEEEEKKKKKKKKKKFFTYLFPECKEKCIFSNNSINILNYGTLPRVKNGTITMLRH